MVAQLGKLVFFHRKAQPVWMEERVAQRRLCRPYTGSRSARGLCIRGGSWPFYRPPCIALLPLCQHRLPVNLERFVCGTKSVACRTFTRRANSKFARIIFFCQSLCTQTGLWNSCFKVCGDGSRNETTMGQQRPNSGSTARALWATTREHRLAVTRA